MLTTKAIEKIFFLILQYCKIDKIILEKLVIRLIRVIVVTKYYTVL